MESKASNTHSFLDSLVVRISACHVEGPGSIPGRGGIFYPQHIQVKTSP